MQVDRITWGKLSQAFPEIRVGHFIVATVYCTQLENNSVRHLHMNLGPGKSGLSKTRRWLNNKIKRKHSVLPLKWWSTTKRRIMYRSVVDNTNVYVCTCIRMYVYVCVYSCIYIYIEREIQICMRFFFSIIVLQLFMYLYIYIYIQYIWSLFIARCVKLSSYMAACTTSRYSASRQPSP